MDFKIIFRSTSFLINSGKTKKNLPNKKKLFILIVSNSKKMAAKCSQA